MESRALLERGERWWVDDLVCRNFNCVFWEGGLGGVPVCVCPCVCLCGSSPDRETWVHPARRADVMSSSTAAQSGLGEGGRTQLGRYYISIGLHVP